MLADQLLKPASPRRQRLIDEARATQLKHIEGYENGGPVRGCA
jgi:hypothetical protein